MSEHHGLQQPTPSRSVRPPVIERVVRPQDADPRRAKRAERLVALSFLVSAIGTAGFIAAYVAFIPHGPGSAGESNRWL
ncbi:MAG: hypothetical protein IRZ02_08605, partial [Acidothermus sp.]|nr:hypothetical protein [Acidothermus sp.]